MSSTQILPPMLFDLDSPRVHRNDPVTSHAAADKSQATVHTVRDRVLQLLTEQGPMAAFEVCDEYAARADWAKVHHESPRKRMSDMKRDGLLVDTGALRMNREGSWESVVTIVGAVMHRG